MSGIERRELLKALTAAGLSLPASHAAAQVQGGDSGTLVAFFSRTGNTALVARQIRRATDAAIFEIEARSSYPEDYDETVAQARRETRSGYLPPLKLAISGIRRFDTVYLAFPTWGMTMPPVVRSFLSAHDLSGKTVHPVNTNGGYGLGDSLDILQALSPKATIRPAFSMRADQEKESLQQVTDWLAG